MKTIEYKSRSFRAICNECGYEASYNNMNDEDFNFMNDLLIFDGWKIENKEGISHDICPCCVNDEYKKEDLKRTITV